MNGVATTGPQDPAAKEVNTDSDRKSAGVTTSGGQATATVEDTGASPQAAAQPAGRAETVSDELPRKRRGILLGTQPGAATPAAADDAKSLAWMATQAVKAVNAVKASQLEQAQAWKAGTGMSEDEQSRSAEDDVAAFDAGESVAMEGQESVQSTPGEPPAATQAVPSVESSQEAAASPRIPAVAHGAAAPRIPARMALMLGVLVMFSYAGYRHWFAGDRAASEVPATTSAIIEPGGPAEEVNLMTPPAISVVAAPEPVAEQSEPPAVEAGMAPPPGPVTDAQPVTAMPPEEPAVPSVRPQEPAAGIPRNRRQPIRHPPRCRRRGILQPIRRLHRRRPKPTWPQGKQCHRHRRHLSKPMWPQVNRRRRHRLRRLSKPDVPARQPVAPAPAARPRYPANGYGYYQPPSSWQRYYRPGYPQAPARQ